MAAAPAPREVPPPWEVPQLLQSNPSSWSAKLHGAEFARRDLAGAHSFSSLGTHILTPGDSVKVKEGMVFSVSETGQS
jgi:hypothetical protein